MTHYYELYPGGKGGGEVAIETDVQPDDYGCILLTEEQYNAGIRRHCRHRRNRDDYHEGYDVIEHLGRYVLCPRTMKFDHPHIEHLLNGEEATQ